jgi:hypothetical protein
MARTGSSPANYGESPSLPLYDALARSILAAGNDREEVRLRTAKAIETIKAEHPLTHPPDDKIVFTLKEHLLRLSKEGVEPLRTVDSLVGMVLDVSKLKTSGASE